MDRNEPIRIENDDVAVTKRYEPDDFAVPTITFEIHSERAEPGAIRLTERIPEEFAIEGIGFHPDYDSDCWTAHDDGRIVFESQLDPETTLITVYGIRIEDDEEADAFMTEPELTVEEFDPIGVETAATTEIVADGAGPDEILPVGTAHVTTVGTGSSAGHESVAATLAAELRSGSVSTADQKTLREALDADVPESERVQLTHLQARVGELEAYTDAFESFLDENGTGERLVADVEDGLSDLREDVEAMGSVLDGTITRHEETIEALETDLASLEGAVDEREDITADIDAVSDDLDALYDDVDELRTWRDQLGMAFGGQ